ncbi:hypothetical protein DDJ52_19620 [Mycobacteroides abscessus]|nr:hypothetical protein DDJ52_19620 [Mycobacteroides abscessus]RIR97935.1 hypothetical protein D2E45_24630 [Mycobacteroides abscessus]
MPRATIAEAKHQAPHHCRGSAGEAQGLMDQDASLVRGVCAERAAVAIPHLAGLGPGGRACSRLNCRYRI